MDLFNLFIQIGVTLFGLLSIFFVNRKDKWHRFGSLFGVAAQPFWFYIMYTTQQWGLFFLCFVYTYFWFLGFYNNWIRKDDESDIDKESDSSQE